MLGLLLGSWSGEGFNAIWVPNTENGHLLMLDRTVDKIVYSDIPGPIPNRGLLQPDIDMRGVTYMQTITSLDTGNTMHIEPGLLAIVPETTHPHVPPTLARLGSIPHGTSVLAQGLVTFGTNAPPISDIDIIAFKINSPSVRQPLAETEVGPTPTKFQRMSTGVTQGMVNNPNSILKAARDSRVIKNFIRFDLTTDNSVAPGGGVANTAFLQGVPGEAPNAVVQKVTCSFWIEFFDDAQGKEQIQLQYTQTVLLNFGGLSWPHVSVATLLKDGTSAPVA